MGGAGVGVRLRGWPGRSWLLVVTRRALDDCWVIYELWHNFILTDRGGKEQRTREREQYNEQREKWKWEGENEGGWEKLQKEGNKETESGGWTAVPRNKWPLVLFIKPSFCRKLRIRLDTLTYTHTKMWIYTDACLPTSLASPPCTPELTPYDPI